MPFAATQGLLLCSFDQKFLNHTIPSAGVNRPDISSCTDMRRAGRALESAADGMTQRGLSPSNELRWVSFLLWHVCDASLAVLANTWCILQVTSRVEQRTGRCGSLRTSGSLQMDKESVTVLAGTPNELDHKTECCLERRRHTKPTSGRDMVCFSQSLLTNRLNTVCTCQSRGGQSGASHLSNSMHLCTCGQFFLFLFLNRTCKVPSQYFLIPGCNSPLLGVGVYLSATVSKGTQTVVLMQCWKP